MLFCHASDSVSLGLQSTLTVTVAFAPLRCSASCSFNPSWMCTVSGSGRHDHVAINHYAANNQAALATQVCVVPQVKVVLASLPPSLESLQLALEAPVMVQR